jgi:hypothetical protein
MEEEKCQEITMRNESSFGCEGIKMDQLLRYLGRNRFQEKGGKEAFIDHFIVDIQISAHVEAQAFACVRKSILERSETVSIKAKGSNCVSSWKNFNSFVMYEHAFETHDRCVMDFY